MEDQTDTQRVAMEISTALASVAQDEGISFSVSVHGCSMAVALAHCEAIAGKHREARINSQPGCIVLSAKGGQGDISFFVRP